MRAGWSQEISMSMAGETGNNKGDQRNRKTLASLNKIKHRSQETITTGRLRKELVEQEHGGG